MDHDPSRSTGDDASEADATEAGTGDDATTGSSTSDSGGRTEHFRVSGDQLLSKVKQLVREGNIRRISIRTEEGRTLLEIPLSIGVVGAFLAPTFAAIGAVAALVTSCSIVVERAETE